MYYAVGPDFALWPDGLREGVMSAVTVFADYPLWEKKKSPYLVRYEAVHYYVPDGTHCRAKCCYERRVPVVVHADPCHRDRRTCG